LEVSERSVRVCAEKHVVGEEHLARHLRERGKRILSTPCLVLMLEATARKCLEAVLGDGRTSVGYRVDVRHRRPVPEGATVEVEATLVDFDGRRAVFHLKAYSGGEPVAEAVHERYVVE